MDSQDRRSSMTSTTQDRRSSMTSTTQERRSSMTSTASTASRLSSVVGNGSMTEDQQEERRRQIQEIMRTPNLSQKEKSKQIQYLMDGRRRASISSSVGSIQSAHMQHRVPSLNRVSDFEPSEVGVAALQNNSNSNNPRDVEEDTNSDDCSVSATSQSGTDTGPHVVLPAGLYRTLHGRANSLVHDRGGRRFDAIDFLDPLQRARLMEKSRPPCEHYERNCTFVSPCCGMAFGCRICHDEYPDLPPPIYQRPSPDDNENSNNNNEDEFSSPPGGRHSSRVATRIDRRRSMPIGEEEEPETHHLIDRFAVKEVICRKCYTRQSSKTKHCISCGIQFGEYHCSICNLWMSNDESPYHCSSCGFCRVGGRKNFRHCDDCGMCIDVQLFEDHNCKSGKYMSNCPICQEDLFSSRFASHEMPCGHAIHWHCFKQLTTYDTRCPVCKKTCESHEQMQAAWSALAMGIAMQPVPPDLCRMVNITCSDCEISDYNRRWHFLGVGCMHCFSFNTTVDQILMQGRDAAAYLDALEASQATEAGGVPANISMPTLNVPANSGRQNEYHEMQDRMDDEPSEDIDDLST